MSPNRPRRLLRDVNHVALNWNPARNRGAGLLPSCNRWSSACECGAPGVAALVATAFWWGWQPRHGGVPPILRPLGLALGLALIAEAICSYLDWGTVPLGPFLIACSAATALIVATRGLASFEQKRLQVAHWDICNQPRLLLDRKLAGAVLEMRESAEERQLRRISAARLRPSDLIWSDMIREARPVVALQAIYSNLIGLALLIALAPLLFFLAVAARLEAGPGPFFHKVECSGFQGVPFLRWGFPIRHRISGELTRAGRALTKLRLAGLPQLINLVRGEMGLFGPVPVRTVFADYLDCLSPVFSLRFMAKPGIFGWAQAQGGAGGAKENFALRFQEESLRIAYELYYLQFGSPFMDLEILGRTVLRPILPRGA